MYIEKKRKCIIVLTVLSSHSFDCKLVGTSGHGDNSVFEVLLLIPAHLVQISQTLLAFNVNRPTYLASEIL